MRWHLLAAIVTSSVIGCGRTETPPTEFQSNVSLDTQADLSHKHSHQHGEPHRHDHDHKDGFTGAHAHPHAHGHRHDAAPHGGKILSLKSMTGEPEVGASSAENSSAEKTPIGEPNPIVAAMPSRPHLELLSSGDGRIVFFLLQEDRDGRFGIETPDPPPATASITLVWDADPGQPASLKLPAQRSEAGYVTETLAKMPFSEPGSLPEINRTELAIGQRRWVSDERWSLDLPTGLDGDLYSNESDGRTRRVIE